ncbi:hypothetical protein L7F22_016215, partial [Adiantum nelumboides]|nr:hypothetical protein [Adiantum nelumboides]
VLAHLHPIGVDSDILLGSHLVHMLVCKGFWTLLIKFMTENDKK